MSSYVSSSDNRVYVASEMSYGAVSSIGSTNRIPAIKLAVQERLDKATRRDKTGGRTFLGNPTGLRKQISYTLSTYMTGWSDTESDPASGAPFQAAMGALPQVFSGGTVSSSDGNGTIRFSSPHGLTAGQAVVIGEEMRFVRALVDGQTVNVNAPFSTTPQTGTPVRSTLTYKLGRDLSSFSIFDYWSPAEAVQRVLGGAAVDEFKVAINGDFHQFEFRGPARLAIDSETFSAGDFGLSDFPVEPSDLEFDYSLVPGHLGQVWLGATPNRFYALTDAQARVRNGIETRNREFGLEGPRAITAGQRTVSVDFDVFASSDAASKELFQAARQSSPISAMLQLGQQPGQLFGAFLKSVVPEVPDFDDAETRLRWRFSGCRAQGTSDDELVIAIG